MRRRDLVFYIPVAVAGGFFLWFGVRTYNLRFRPRPGVGEPTWKGGPKVAVARRGELAVWQAKPFEYPLPLGPLKAFLLRLPEPVLGGAFPGGGTLPGRKPHLHPPGLHRELCARSRGGFHPLQFPLREALFGLPVPLWGF